MNFAEQPQAAALKQQLTSFQGLHTQLLEKPLQPTTLPKLMAYQLDIARVANALQQQQAGEQRAATRRILENALEDVVRLALAARLSLTQLGQIQAGQMQAGQARQGLTQPGQTQDAQNHESQTQDQGHLCLVLADAKDYRCPVGDCGLTLPLWLDALFAAIILADTQAIDALADHALAERLAAHRQNTQRVGNEPFWLAYAQALIGALNYLRQVSQGWQDPAQASALTDQAARCAQLMRAPGIIDPACLASIDRPVLELLAGLIQAPGAGERWQHGWQKALRGFDRYYQQEDNRHLLPGYLPLGLTALAALARQQGGSLAEIPAPVPDWLLRAQENKRNNARDNKIDNPSTAGQSLTADVTYYFPRRSILSANEAHWFLDLRGFPRQGRTQELIEQFNEPQQQMIARYHAYHGPATGRAIAEFVLLDSADIQQAEPVPPLALDAGELLFLAESFAGDGASKRELLVDAIACVNSVIARIPAQQDSIDPHSISSAEGKALFDAEPGRFRRDRLQAYREGLQRALQSLDRGDSEQQAPSQDKRDSAAQSDPLARRQQGLQQELEHLQQSVTHSALALIRSEVEQVIQAIGEDVSGVYIRQLQPRDGDFEQIFSAEAVEPARRFYRTFYQNFNRQGFKLHYPSPAHRIESHICPAGFLAQDMALNKDFLSNKDFLLSNGSLLSKNFPQGYRRIAPWLKPERVWVAWRYIKPGAEAGINYDGLVFVDDHWVWLPKPYRALASLVAAKP